MDAALSFSARDLLRGLKVGDWRQSSLQWSRMGRPAGNISYQVDAAVPGDAWLRLMYTTTNRLTGEATVFDYRVRMESTPCNYGGVRWWFRCPRCGRRVLTLHLAPGADRFACRLCHDLTYTSCQESHKYDRLFRELARETGHAWEDVRDALSRL